MAARDWGELVVSGAQFDHLKRQVMARPRSISIHWLDHETLDRLYVMILPDGSLTVPCGPDYRSFGSFLDIPDLDTVLGASSFDFAKHARHARGWSKTG